MECLAVLDTNILVSALISSQPNAATVQIVSRMIMGEITPVYCKEIMTEYREVLNRRKFGFPKELVDRLLAVIEKYGLYCAAGQTDIPLPDEKDRPFYNVILEKQEEGAYLVTGNLRHFPSAPYIVSARQFVEILEQTNL